MGCLGGFVVVVVVAAEANMFKIVSLYILSGLHNNALEDFSKTIYSNFLSPCFYHWFSYSSYSVPAKTMEVTSCHFAYSPPMTFYPSLRVKPKSLQRHTRPYTIYFLLPDVKSYWQGNRRQTEDKAESDNPQRPTSMGYMGHSSGTPGCPKTKERKNS